MMSNLKPKSSGLPDPKCRHTGEHDLKYKPHVGEIRNQRVTDQKYRRNQKNPRRYGISPDPVRPRDVRPLAAQDIDRRGAGRVHSPDSANAGIGLLVEIAK